MSLKKALFGLYILIILFVLGYAFYYELSNRQFDDFVDKDIVVIKIDRVTHKGGATYTISDNENNTYFFSSAEESSILNTITYRNKIIKMSIKYNTRNNEISEVRDGLEINKTKIINREYIIMSLITIAAVLLYFLLKMAIEDEWFFRSNMN